MSDTSIRRIKDLLVGACESIKDGHRDIASSLADVMLDEIAKIEPEDIELGFAILNTEEPAQEIASDGFEDFPELTDEVEHADFRDRIRSMVASATTIV